MKKNRLVVIAKYGDATEVTVWRMYKSMRIYKNASYASILRMRKVIDADNPDWIDATPNNVSLYYEDR